MPDSEEGESLLSILDDPALIQESDRGSCDDMSASDDKVAFVVSDSHRVSHDKAFNASNKAQKEELQLLRGRMHAPEISANSRPTNVAAFENI